MNSLLRLKPYLRPYLWLIVGSGLLAIPLAALRMAPAPLLQHVLSLLEAHDRRKLALFPLLVIALYGANFVVRFFHYYLLRIVIGRVNQRIKNELFEHVLGLSADYFTSQSTGTLISRVGMDPQYIDAGLSCINVIIREPLTFLALVGYALYKSWKLTLVTVAILPPLAYVFTMTGRNLKRYITRMTGANAELVSTLQESFSGIRVVKAFRLEKYVRKQFRERSETFTRYYLKTAVLEEASHPAVELLTAFAIAGVIYFGGLQVVENKMQPPEVIAFLAAFGMMMNPLRMINEVNAKLHQAAGACDRIFEIFDWKSHLHEPAEPRRIRSLEREIRFREVSFAYPDSPERQVLRKVSFSVEKGHAIALAGKSGSGKSSLVNLLPRIFDVTGGTIEIDGQDIRQLALEDLRKLVAVVSQDVFLFNDSISENIRCGRLSATREEIREAARKAHALEFIESLPEGFETVIGDRGQKLSGGQRQRLSIARAFLREAPILILDEATSALDTESERAVQSALDELMQNRTTIMIAHRLTTIQHVDRIFVMRDGEIVESGTHDELVRLGGEYARFHEVHA